MFRIDADSRTLEVKDGFSGWITIDECCTNSFTIKALREYADANISVESHRNEVKQIAIGTRGKGGKMEAIDKLPSMVKRQAKRDTKNTNTGTKGHGSPDIASDASAKGTTCGKGISKGDKGNLSDT